MAKRRKGYFKPEFRLWTLIPAYTLGPVGLLMWGFGLGRHLHPMVAIVGSGISYGVLCAVPAVGMTYVVDSHRPVSGETMTILTAFKNTFAFALSFAVTPWIEKDGYSKVRFFLPSHYYQAKLTAQRLGRRLDGLDRRSHLCDNHPHVYLWRKDSTMVRQVDHLRKILPL